MLYLEFIAAASVVSLLYTWTSLLLKSCFFPSGTSLTQSLHCFPSAHFLSCFLAVNNTVNPFWQELCSLALNCAPLKCFGCDDVLCSKEDVSTLAQPSSPQAIILKAAASSVQGAGRCTALVWIRP